MEILAPKVGLGGKSLQKAIEFEYSYYKLGSFIQNRYSVAKANSLIQFSLKVSTILQICSDENGIIRALITKEYFWEIKA